MVRTLLSIVGLVACLAVQPSAQGAPSKADSHAARPTAQVNLNTATATQLRELPGIGAKTAERILEYRQKKGPFKKIEDILESSRSCPYLLMFSRLSAHRSVSGNR